MISLEEANKRFSDRTDIKLVEYIGWTKKSKFFDLVIKEEFWAKPKYVYKTKSSHPKRKIEKIKQTIIEKYGVTNMRLIDGVEEKISKTNMKRYGTINPAQSIEVRNKISKKHVQNNSDKKVKCEIQNKKIETCLKNYGTEYPLQSSIVKEKYNKTIVDKYGVENLSQNNEIKRKKKETVYKNFGVEHQMFLPEIKNKVVKGNIKYFIKETNEPVLDWYKKLKYKPPVATLREYLQSLCSFETCYNEKYISINEIVDFINNHKQSKTSLEIISKRLFQTEHYNQKPKEITDLYRPDFKISDKIFVNVDGLYWHSEKNKDRCYHYDLYKTFEKAGLKIFQFYDNEIRNKPQIVKSIIDIENSVWNNQIDSSQCFFSIVNQKDAANFLENNCLKGGVCSKHIGMYHNNELVLVLSYKIIKSICKIQRYCEKINTNIINGFDLAIKNLEKTLCNKVESIEYCVDLRYETERRLESNDFIQTKETIGYCWTDSTKVFSKYTPLNKTKNLNLHRIYNAGQRTYVKKYNKK